MPRIIAKAAALLPLLIAALLPPAGVAAAAEQSFALAGLSVTAWTPDTSAEKAPVVIFSHGFHGCATQSRFLMQAMAKAGYLVFAPNHRDATCNGGNAHWRDKPEEKFGRLDAWSDSVYRDRADDIRHLLAALQADPAWGPRGDWARLALAGHSLGGYTVLGLAGAWPAWKLVGVKAVLALSPYAQPFIKQGTLSGLAAPVMYQGGTSDMGITPAIARSGGGYDQSPPPKYLVEFAGAGHLAWTNRTSDAHAGIAAYAVAFLDHYVRDMPAAPALTQSAAGVAAFRYASELGTGGSAAAESGSHPILDRLRARRAPQP